MIHSLSGLKISQYRVITSQQFSTASPAHCNDCLQLFNIDIILKRCLLMVHEHRDRSQVPLHTDVFHRPCKDPYYDEIQYYCCHV